MSVRVPATYLNQLEAEKAALVAALKDARRFAINAINANVDLEGFDPTTHVLIVKIDNALAFASEVSA